MKQFRIVTAVCAFSLSIAQVNAEDQLLVDEGKAYAEIIISDSPARSMRLAAAELQTYVTKISGARLPIRAELSADVPVQIYTGESPQAAKLGVTADRLEHGAYRIASGEKWLALIGDDTDFTLKRGVGSVQIAVFGEEDVRAGKPVTDEVRLQRVVTQFQNTDDTSGAPGK